MKHTICNAKRYRFSNRDCSLSCTFLNMFHDYDLFSSIVWNT